MIIAASDPRATAFGDAIRGGDLDVLRALLSTDPELAVARFGDERESRSALHVAVDWPGHTPNVAAVIGMLVDAGADVDARFVGNHREAPVHWAASSDDVDALEALLLAGADIEADGGVLTDGPPLDDAVIFNQWNAARLLVERGATTKLFHAAALGLGDRLAELLRTEPSPEEITNALWHACNVGAGGTAEQLLDAGGDPHWVGWNHMTPLAAARASGNDELVAAITRRSASPPS